MLFVMTVESGPAHARDLAGVARLEALKLHHASDLSVDAVAPVSVFFRRDSSTRLKALRKKSRSSDCCPILRSNSATRRGVGTQDRAAIAGSGFFAKSLQACRGVAPEEHRNWRDSIYGEIRSMMQLEGFQSSRSE